MVTDGRGTMHCLSRRLGGANYLNKQTKTENKKKPNKNLSFIFPFTGSINTLQLLHNSTLYTQIVSVVVYLLRL